MKLKPLIKTHWLASQNPMTVSLSGLRRVIFTPPPGILSSEFFHEGAGSALPSANEVRFLPPDEKEIREVRAQSHTFSRDLFWVLFSGHEASYLRPPPASLKHLVHTLEFHFEDGPPLSMLGIFRQPQFPLFLNPRFYLQDPSCNWEKALDSSLIGDFMNPLKVAPHQRRHDDFKRAWLTILEILAWSLQRQRQVGDLEVLWTDSHGFGAGFDDVPRAGFHLHDIEFLRELPLAATIMAEPGEENCARLRIWQGADLQSPPGVLRFRAAESLSELEAYFHVPSQSPLAATAEVLEAERAALPKASWSWVPQLMIRESESLGVAKSLARIEHSTGKNQIYFVDHFNVNADGFKPQLRIRERDGSLQMAVAFAMDSLKLSHHGFPASLLPALSAFSGGIDRFFQVERKETASKKSLHRANDLLFLRHQGLALFCLLELINWILRRPLTSGELIAFPDEVDSADGDRQFQKFMEYLQNSAPALLGKAAVPYEDLISARVQKLFLDFVEKTYQFLLRDQSLLFQAGKVIEIGGIHRQVLPLVRFLILYFVESSQGKLLTRAQSPLSERFVEALPAWTSPHLATQEAAEQPGAPVQWVDIGLYDQYLIPLLFELSDQGIEIELNGAPLLGQENPFEFIFSVTSSDQKEDSNWFDLHPQIFFNGTRVLPEEVKINFGQGSPQTQTGFIEYQGQIYRIDKKQMPSLKSLQRFWNKIKGNHQSVKHNSFGERVYRLPRSQALELLMLKAQGIDVQGEGEWRRIFAYFEKGLGTDKIQLPDTMWNALLPHQQEGAQWLHDLYQLKLGAILADEMGLGKTFQVLAFLVSLHQKNELKKSLVVVPTSLVYNWMDEKKKFAPELPLQIFHSAQKEALKETLANPEPLVLVATYGLLNENPDFFQSQEWNILIFDEAQNLKNITSLRAVSARKLRAQFKACLTGTPMENNYLEFFSICDLVVPGSLGGVDDFRKEYFNREVSNDSLRELRLIARPLLLRRTKAQVKLSLPEKTLHKVSLPFAAKQKDIYKKMAMTFSRQVEDLVQVQGERKAQIAMFAALMRLRQICSDPAAVPGVVYDEQPAKVEHFLSSLQEHLENQESVIVFTQFLSTLNRIERELLKIKVPTFTLQGNVSAKERLRLISAFQDSGEPGVMLMTLKTGGVGLNLTKASVVYHLEPWWNPAVENQATDRAHRMGQTKNVKVYNLLIEGSLEERIADLKLKKQGSFDRLFGSQERADEAAEETGFEGSSSLTKDDFIYLLK
jgi:superfamily II DNA or RNA helicase